MKLIFPIILCALALGLLFPRMNARLWAIMSVVIIAVLAYFYLKS